jgi:hypothetical protein
MHVQVVTYRMADISEPDFIEANREFAETMAGVPGLLAKVWLKDPDESVYGGLYLWRDREAYESFLASELWAEVLGDDSMIDTSSHDFAVMVELTKATQPGTKLV